MSLTETIPGSRLPASRVVLFEEDTLGAFVPEFPPPFENRVRPNAEEDLKATAEKIRLPRNLREYRALFLLKGTSIPKWAKKHGYSGQYIYDILGGARDGDKAQAIREKIDAYLDAK